MEQLKIAAAKVASAAGYAEHELLFVNVGNNTVIEVNDKHSSLGGAAFSRMMFRNKEELLSFAASI